MRKIIASLDVGSSFLKLVVGEMYKHKLNIITSVEVPSRGIKKGFVINQESALESLKEIFDKAKLLIGLDIKKVVVTVPNYNSKTFFSVGSTSIKGIDKVVTNKDIIYAMNESTRDKIPDNAELVGSLPTSFILNDVDNVSNPVGHIADKLTVKTVSTIVPKKNVIPIVKCLKQLDIEVIDITLGIMGDYYEFKTKDTENMIGAVVNIGASKTEIGIFNKGILTNSTMINGGSEQIDTDLSYVNKLKLEDSIYIKENLCLADKKNALVSENLEFTNIRGDIVRVNQYEVSEIANARLIELLNLIKKHINLLTKKEISYIMVTGGLTELEFFDEVVEEVLTRKARIMNTEEIGVRNNKYSSSAGLIKYYNSRLKLWGIEFSVFNAEQQEELSGIHKKLNLSDKPILGKIFRYFS